MPQKKEYALVTQLKDIVPVRIAYFVEWYMTPKEEREPFEELSRKHLQDVSWDIAKEWVKRQDVQEALQYYLKQTKTLNLVSIYQKMLIKALNGDVNAAKWVESFSKSDFFKEGKSEIDKLIDNLNIES